MQRKQGNFPAKCLSKDHGVQKSKRNQILSALEKDPVDVGMLRQLSISRGGLLDNNLRQKAWPLLLDIDIENIPSKPSEQVLHSHKDYNQVVLDVNRSMKRFPPGMLEEVRLSYQDQLIDCIMWILITNHDLHYYQGFHDVVVTFLLVVGEDLTFAIVNKLCKNHFRDFMEMTMEKTNYMLNYLFPIIGKANPKLRDFLERSEVGTIFCLSWLITWYGHVLNDLKDIVRLYDFFIACHPLMPIYLAADIVLFRREEVMACECEMPYVHKLLSQIPDDLPFEKLIVHSGDLFLQYPPSVLQHEAKMQHEKILRASQARQLETDRRIMRKRGVKPKRQMGFFMKLTVCTFIGAVSAVTFNMWSRGRFDWPALTWT